MYMYIICLFQAYKNLYNNPRLTSALNKLIPCKEITTSKESIEDLEKSSDLYGNSKKIMRLYYYYYYYYYYQLI